jgi:fumarate reductase flavoprotein subunit
VGLPIELPTDFDYPGHSVKRMHTVPGRQGAAMLRGLHEKAREYRNIDLLVPSTLDDIRPLPDGEWAATVESPDGTRESVNARAILLATNGFGANAALVSGHLPEIAGAIYHGSDHSRGDALRFGAAVGARTGYLDAYQGHGALSAAARTLITWATIMHGAVLTNTSGHRFGNETVGYSEYAALLAAQPDAAGWLVFDERIHRLCLPFTDYRNAVDSGAVLTASSVPALATRMAVAADTLQAELAEAASVAQAVRTADRFGRTHFEAELSPPLRAVQVMPALFHTQGGLLVDGHARVLGRNGPIPGLYASGGAAAGISGHGATGYLAGNGLLPALGLAYLAAEHLAGPHPAGQPPTGAL